MSLSCVDAIPITRRPHTYPSIGVSQGCCRDSNLYHTLSGALLHSPDQCRGFVRMVPAELVSSSRLQCVASARLNHVFLPGRHGDISHAFLALSFTCEYQEQQCAVCMVAGRSAVSLFISPFFWQLFSPFALSLPHMKRGQGLILLPRPPVAHVFVLQHYSSMYARSQSWAASDLFLILSSSLAVFRCKLPSTFRQQCIPLFASLPHCPKIWIVACSTLCQQCHSSVLSFRHISYPV